MQMASTIDCVKMLKEETKSTILYI